MAVCGPESRLSPHAKSAGALTLDFVAFSTLRNTCLFLSHQYMIFLLEQLKWTKILSKGTRQRYATYSVNLYGLWNKSIQSTSGLCGT